MTITIPTVDEFTESTVMLVIREIAEYICGDTGLVTQINNNDITGFTSSYNNNVLKIDATKGDGSTIPVCNVTIEGGGSSTGNPYPTAVNGTVGSNGNITFTITMSSGSPLTTTINMNYFASASDLSDLQEQVTGIKPIVTTNLESSPPTITVAVNGSSSTANLPSGGKLTSYTLKNYNSLQNIVNDIADIPIGSIIYYNFVSSEDVPTGGFGIVTQNSGVSLTIPCSGYYPSSTNAISIFKMEIGLSLIHDCVIYGRTLFEEKAINIPANIQMSIFIPN